jgi:hypothetical protein
MENSDDAQNRDSGGISFGEACFFSGSEFADTEDSDILTAARICHFSQSVLSPKAWFQIADELIAAMNAVGRNVERFWEDFNSIIFAADMTTDPPTTYQKGNASPRQHQETDPDTKHALTNQYMMLAGFAIENLCKGYLVSRLRPEEQEKVRSGKLPKRLRNHDVLELVLSTGMKDLPDRVKDLLKRITESAIWRGRYPSPTGQGDVGSFTQWEDDDGQIKTFLPKLRAHVRANQ